MLLPHGTLVALIDSHELRLLRNAGTEAVPVLVPVPTPTLAEPRHASGEQRLAEATHAAVIAEWLHHQAITRQIDHLILIAPPRVLGEVRRHLSGAVEKIIARELAKDLIGRHETEVLAVLRGI